MTRKARVWTGATLILVLAFNYGLIGMPLYRKAASINDRATVMLMAKIKAGKALRTSAEEDYILEIFRREKVSLDRKLVTLNIISITLVIVILSWTAFGLVVHKKDRSKA